MMIAPRVNASPPSCNSSQAPRMVATISSSQSTHDLSRVHSVTKYRAYFTEARPFLKSLNRGLGVNSITSAYLRASFMQDGTGATLPPPVVAQSCCAHPAHRPPPETVRPGTPTSFTAAARLRHYEIPARLHRRAFFAPLTRNLPPHRHHSGMSHVLRHPMEEALQP